MKKKSKKKIKSIIYIFILLLIGGFVIGILSGFVPSLLIVNGRPVFAIFYVVSSIVLLIVYSLISKIIK